MAKNEDLIRVILAELQKQTPAVKAKLEENPFDKVGEKASEIVQRVKTDPQFLKAVEAARGLPNKVGQFELKSKAVQLDEATLDEFEDLRPRVVTFSQFVLVVGANSDTYPHLFDMLNDPVVERKLVVAFYYPDFVTAKPVERYRVEVSRGIYLTPVVNENGDHKFELVQPTDPEEIDELSLAEVELAQAQNDGNDFALVDLEAAWKRAQNK